MGDAGAVAAADPVDRSGNDRARVNTEARRIFETSAWVGPFGATALTVICLALLRNDLPRDRLSAWAALVAVGAVCQVLSITTPSVRRWEAAGGLPRLTYAGHFLIGLGYGLLLWLDGDMVDRADLRWLGLAVMFSMSAGVASGLNGLNVLGLCVLAPMWVIGSIALFVGGEWLAGAAVLLFLTIQVVDQRRSGSLWRELISLRVEQERRIEQQRWIARHDDLTGLLNRAGTLAAIAEIEGRPGSAMYVDLDHFKQVNDRLGHAAGDEVLVEVASRLRSAVRDDDSVGRLGGDEFFIVFGRALTSERIDEVGARIIASIEEPIATVAGIADVSVSIGVATNAARVTDGEQLMAQADHALLRAKRRGRNRVEVYGV